LIALAAILTQLRQWPALVRYQDASTWAHRKVDADTLAGKRVLIVGAGSTGTATARLLAAFGATSTLVASTARDDVHAASELPGLIGGHDIVVITAPLNETTRGLVNKDFLAAMDDGAMLVNAGRGTSRGVAGRSVTCSTRRNGSRATPGGSFALD
jgi:phosphoglycerate dehydrogenase-like enzyme